MLLILSFILIHFGQAVFTMTVQEMETTFNNDMIHRNVNQENPLCILSRGQKNTYCKALFQLPRFQIIIEAEFNRRAFFQFEPGCSDRTISFRTLNLLEDWEQNVLPCFGRHKIPRSRWHEDPFFDTFFVTMSMPENIMYIFGEERTGEKEEIFLIDIVKVKTNPFTLPESEVTKDETDEEEYLNTIEVHSINIRQVEAIYVRDMIRNDQDFPDPFETMEPGKMLTVCLSIFTEIRFTNQGIFIDRQAMFTPTYGPLPKSVHFLYEGQRDNHPQKAYPCRALHESLSFTKSLLVKDRYSIVAGRKLRSIFVFEMIDYAENIRPIGYIENFDFEHLLPSEPSETQIYPNDEQLIQNIQPDVQVF